MKKLEIDINSTTNFSKGRFNDYKIAETKLDLQILE